MKSKLLFVPVFITLMCAPLSGAGPEMFYYSGKKPAVEGGVYTTAAGGNAAYYLEPGIVISARGKSSFSADKKGIVIKTGMLYIENFSGRPMPPVKAGALEIISAGRAFFVSASEKSVEAVKGVTSLKSGSIEASIPEGRKFLTAGITEGGRGAVYEGNIVECIIDEGPLPGVTAALSVMPKTHGIKEFYTEQSGRVDIKIILKIKNDSGVFSVSGTAVQEGSGGPVVIFSELQGGENAAVRAGHAVLKEILSAVYEFDKRGFLSGREVVLVFDTTDSGVISEAEDIIKALPGVKKVEKEVLYGSKTIIKVNTRADGHMIGSMFEERSKRFKPVISHKNKVVF